MKKFKIITHYQLDQEGDDYEFVDIFSPNQENPKRLWNNYGYNDLSQVYLSGFMDAVKEILGEDSVEWIEKNDLPITRG